MRRRHRLTVSRHVVLRRVRSWIRRTRPGVERVRAVSARYHSTRDGDAVVRAVRGQLFELVRVHRVRPVSSRVRERGTGVGRRNTAHARRGRAQRRGSGGDRRRAMHTGRDDTVPAPTPAPLGEREADSTSWTVGAIAMCAYLIVLYVLSRRIWVKEKLTLRFAENDTFLDSIAPAMENTLATRGTLKDFEEDDLRFAIGCFKRGDVREADAVLTKIAERNPNHPNVMHGLAVVRAMAGDIKYAHAFAQRSVSLGETSQRQITLANVLLARGKIEKGIAVYSMAIRRDPVSAVGHFNVGNAHFISGDYANARSSYLAALDREPHYFKALYNISLVLDKIGNVGEAKEWMKRAIDIRPNDIRAVYALALLYLKLGDWKKSEYHFNYALKIDAKHSSSHVKLGNIAFRRGDFLRAGSNYLTALELDPANVEALTNMAMLDWCKGSLTACNEHLRLALTIDPRYYPALYNLAVTRLSQGRVEECLKYYQRAKACRTPRRWPRRKCSISALPSLTWTK